MTNLQDDLQALTDTLDDFISEYGQEALRGFLRQYLSNRFNDN